MVGVVGSAGRDAAVLAEDEPAGGAADRVLTIPNALSLLRLLGVPLFLYLLLGPQADGWAIVVLAVSGLRLPRRQGDVDGGVPTFASYKVGGLLAFALAAGCHGDVGTGAGGGASDAATGAGDEHGAGCWGAHGFPVVGWVSTGRRSRRAGRRVV